MSTVSFYWYLLSETVEKQRNLTKSTYWEWDKSGHPFADDIFILIFFFNEIYHQALQVNVFHEEGLPFHCRGIASKCKINKYVCFLLINYHVRGKDVFIYIKWRLYQLRGTRSPAGTCGMYNIILQSCHMGIHASTVCCMTCSVKNKQKSKLCIVGHLWKWPVETTHKGSEVRKAMPCRNAIMHNRAISTTLYSNG